MEPPRTAVISPPRINETRLVEKSEHFFFEPIDVRKILFEESFDLVDTSDKKLLSITPHLFAIHLHAALKHRRLKEPLKWILVGTNAAFEIFTKINNPYVTKNDLDLSDLKKSEDFDIRVEIESEAIPLLEECVIDALRSINRRLDSFHLKNHGWERKKFVTDDNLHGLILAFGNRKGKRLDICFYSKLEPKSLFSRDDAQLDITQAIIDGSLAIPIQNYFHPLQPIIDRKNKILRISEPEKVNEYGWPLLVYYLSTGYSLADPSQEAILLATFQRKVPKDKQKDFIEHILKNHSLQDPKAFIFSFLSKLGISPDLSYLPPLNQPYEALRCFAFILHPNNPYIEHEGKKWHLPLPSSDCFKPAYQRRTAPFEFGIQHVVELAHWEGKNPLSTLPRKAFFFLRAILSRYPVSELHMLRYRALLDYKGVFQSVVASEFKDHLLDLQVFTFFFPHALLMPQLLDQIVEGIQNLTLSKKMYREALLMVRQQKNTPLLQKLLSILQKKGEIEEIELEMVAESALMGVDHTEYLIALFRGLIISHFRNEIFENLLKHRSYEQLKSLFQGIDHVKVHTVLIKALLNEERWKEACNLGHRYKLLPLCIAVLIEKKVLEWLSKLIEKDLLKADEIEAFIELVFSPPALPYLDLAFRKLESEKIPVKANCVLRAFLDSTNEISLKDREVLTPYFLTADVNLFIPFFTRYHELPFLKSEMYVEMYLKASPLNQKRLFEWALQRKVIKLSGIPHPQIAPPLSLGDIQSLKDHVALAVITPHEAIQILSQDPIFHPWILELIQAENVSYAEDHFDSWSTSVRLEALKLLPRWSSERIERLCSELDPFHARKLLTHPKIPSDVLARHLDKFYENSGYLEIVKAYPPKTREDYLKVFQHKDYLEALFPKFLEEVKNGAISIDQETFRPFLHLIIKHESIMVLECLNPPFIDCLSDHLEVMKLASDKIPNPSSPLIPILWDLAQKFGLVPRTLLKLSLQGVTTSKFIEACLWIARDNSSSFGNDLSCEAIKNYHRFESSLKALNQEQAVQEAIEKMIIRPPETAVLSALANSPSPFLQMMCLKENVLLFDGVTQTTRGSEGEAVYKLIDKVFREGQNIEACALGRLIIEHPHAPNFFSQENLKLLHQSHLLCVLKMAVAMPLERKKAVIETLYSLDKQLPCHDSEFRNKLAHVYFDLIISFLETGETSLFNEYLWKFYFFLIYEKAASQELTERNQNEFASKIIFPEVPDLKVPDAKVIKIVGISKILNQKLLKIKNLNEKTLYFVNQHLLGNLKHYFLRHKDIFLELMDQYLYFMPLPSIDNVKKRREGVKSILSTVVTSQTFDARRSFEYQVYMNLEYPPIAPKVILSEELRIQALLRILRFALQCDDFSFIDFLPIFRIVDEAKKEFKNFENPELVSLMDEFSKGVRKCPFHIEDNCSMIVYTTKLVLTILQSLKHSNGKGAPFAIMQAKNILSAFKQADNEQREMLIRHSYQYMFECIRLNAFVTSLIPYYALVEGLFPYYIPSLNFINRLDPITVLLIKEPRGLIQLEKEVRAKTLYKWILALFDSPGDTKLIPHHIINNFNIVHRVFNEAPQEKVKYEALLSERNILPEGLQEMVILKS